MHIFSTIEELTVHLKTYIWPDKKLGFVPTMGAIHKGHICLIERAKATSDVTLASIFVNPAQFNNRDDFDNYPVQILEDIELLKGADCDILFAPSKEEMYPSEKPLTFDFGHLDKVMEGAFRPGHFSGVGLIVSKLFNIVRPDIAYFGQKDLQQVAVIRKLVEDLNFPISVVTVPTVRESNGLAMSSRNQRLTTQGRESAGTIHEFLQILKEKIISNSPVRMAISEVTSMFAAQIGLDLEYLELVDSHTLTPIDSIYECAEVSLCVAAHVEGVRLIDNIYVKKQE